MHAVELDINPTSAIFFLHLVARRNELISSRIEVYKPFQYGKSEKKTLYLLLGILFFKLFM